MGGPRRQNLRGCTTAGCISEPSLLPPKMGLSRIHPSGFSQVTLEMWSEVPAGPGEVLGAGSPCAPCPESQPLQLPAQVWAVPR